MREAIGKLWRAAGGVLFPDRPGIAIRPGAFTPLPTATADMEGWLAYVPGTGTYTCQKIGAAYVWTLAGAGDVTGPAASVDGEIVLFSSTTGKVIKRATGTGLVTATSGVYGTTTAPTFSDFTNANHDHGDADDGGSLVASITLTTPTIASFTNAQHNHSNAAGGGNIASTSVTGLALVWLATNNPSSASSSSFDNVFTSTYANYMVVGRLSMSASNIALTMRMRVGAADSSSANYYYSIFAFNSSAGSGAAGGAAGTSFTLNVAQGVGVTTSDLEFVLFFSGPQATDETLYSGHSSFRTSTPLQAGNTLAGLYNATTSYDGFSIIPASGNITGSIKVYGLRDS